ncbi:MAG: tetratricopeptide repeat protein [Planctomycetota bacterium]
MRVHLKTAIVVTLSAMPATSIAAPNSMLQCMPESEAHVQADQAGKPSRMAWLTKWFGKKPAAQAVAPAVPHASYPPTMAYEPAATPAGPANSSWGVFSPAQALATVTPEPATTPIGPTTSPITNVQPTAQAASVATPAPAAPISDAKALREQGHAKDREGQLIAAENLYRQAIGADPTSAAAVNDLGLCLARQGKLEPSIATLRQAIMMRPDKPLYRNNIATVLVEVGQTQEALAHLKTAYGPAAAHYNLGQLLTRAGRTNDAIAQLNQALEIEPTLGPARDALSMLTASQPKFAAQPQPTPAVPSPTPTPAPPAYLSQAPAAPAGPVATPAPAYAPAQVAAAPPRVEPTEEAPAGAPTFPRLLPPVLSR